MDRPFNRFAPVLLLLLGLPLSGARADEREPVPWRPSKAAAYSLLCPGCGYFYLGEPERAAAYLGATAALVGAGLGLLAGGDLEPAARPPGPNRQPTTAPLAVPVLNAAQNLWFYGVFASYRDARLRRNEEGYRYPVSREQLTDLASAPFRPSVLARPWFWAGLPVLLGAAVGFSALIAGDEPVEAMRTLGDPGGVWFLGRRYGARTGFALGESYYAGLFVPVGIGEEALFRGALQPGLTEMLGLWPGWAVTSLIFGAAHALNFTQEEDGLSLAAKAVPFIAATGSYLGLVAIKTGFQLETSVALHFWYDFLLGTTSFIFDPDNQPFALRFGLPF
jgi:membrane protease YdiL (CAAX protease family)